jgi:hypothetical protein
MLDRIGRSRRDGPLVDLELVASVQATGPHTLENIERMIVVVEANRYSIRPLPQVADPQGDIHFLGFLVHVPVSLRLEEPRGPQVREPLRTRTVVGRRLTGAVVDTNGRGIAGAYVRAVTSGQAVACDAAGRFALLTDSEPPVQDFTIVFQGRSRKVTADTESWPVTLQWE